MSIESLSLAEARRISLAAQGFAALRLRGAVTRRHLHRVLERTGLLQIDSVSYAVWLYFLFTLSLRDVEELLAQRGIEVSYETIRCRTLKFGGLDREEPAAPTGQAHGPLACRRDGGEDRGQDALAMASGDDEGVVLDMFVKRRRNKKAAR